MWPAWFPTVNISYGLQSWWVRIIVIIPRWRYLGSLRIPIIYQLVQNQEGNRCQGYNRMPRMIRLKAVSNLLVTSAMFCIKKKTYSRTKLASTHGNHNIYVSELASGKHVRILRGHPRTPWCIAFHPSHPQLIGSGCLGGQVRVWDIASVSATILHSTSVLLWYLLKCTNQIKIKIFLYVLQVIEKKGRALFS